MTKAARPEPLFPDVAGYAGYLARKGAALLDSHGPAGWRGMVAVATLDIGSVMSCVLAQIYQAQWQAHVEATGAARTTWRVAHRAFIAGTSNVDPGDSPNEVFTSPYAMGERLMWEASGSPEDLPACELARSCGFASGWLSDIFEDDQHPEWKITNDALHAAWREILTPAS